MINTLRITSVVAAILAGVFIVFPVMYGVRGDKQVFLFSIKPEFQSDLDNETISEELLKEFERNYRPLFEDTTVSVQEVGKEWIIANEANEVDKSKKYSYSIIKTDLDLRIYESFEQFEDSSVKDQFSNTTGNKAKTSMSQESPLVKQANAFAKYLNPEKLTAPKTSTKGAKIPSISSKVNVTPQFQVYATIVCPGNPNLSQALIDEPGRGRHWVRQSSMVGHIFIEQVKDGLVVIKSGDETSNLEITEKAETGSPSRPSAASSLKSSQSPVKPPSTAFSRAASNVTRTRNIPKRAPVSSRDEERIDELVDKLKDLQQSSASDKTDSKIDPEERNARIQELISKYKSIRVSAEESEKLDDMGEEMKGIQEDPNSFPPEADENEVDEDGTEEEEQANPPKLDKSAKK